MFYVLEFCTFTFKSTFCLEKRGFLLKNKRCNSVLYIVPENWYQTVCKFCGKRFISRLCQNMYSIGFVYCIVLLYSYYENAVHNFISRVVRYCSATSWGKTNTVHQQDTPLTYLSLILELGLHVSTIYITDMLHDL